MLSPIAFLMEHRKAIVKQYRQDDGKPKKTWDSLLKSLPQVSESMSFNTFKQYMSVFVGVTNGLDKVIQQRDELIEARDNLIKDLKKTTQQNSQLKSQVQTLKTRLDKVRQSESTNPSVINGLEKNTKRICGWNVRQSKDGYYRCYRKIAKRVHSVYVGKDLDFKKAQARITEKEKALGLL